MPAPFATLEARVNSAVFKHLANAEGVLDGVPVSGIFDNAYALSNVGVVGMESAGPAFTMATASVPAAVRGKVLVVDGLSYSVQGHEPDGTGVSVLLLERVL